MLFRSYFNIDWLVTDTILTIHNLVELCKTLKVELVCLFDGDIWNYTESDYNQIVLGYNISPKNFLQGELASKFQSLLPVELHQTKSLIEYARERNLPIYNPTCKLHPPSNVHLNWFRDTILPKIKFQTYSLQQSYLDKVDSFSKEWNNQK